ncbi:hypothetical protein [Parafilimonas sp.]|uniref:hypothetical protein n=1 Tax=Parafilimonas sp. TaxID=1969739 RepID=UPI0039E632A9
MARGIWLFIAGIVISEILLMMQGLDAITYTGVPYINETLLGAAAIMFAGMLLLNAGTKHKKYVLTNS